MNTALEISTRLAWILQWVRDAEGVRHSEELKQIIRFADSWTYEIDSYGALVTVMVRFGRDVFHYFIKEGWSSDPGTRFSTPYHSALESAYRKGRSGKEIAKSRNQGTATEENESE